MARITLEQAMQDAATEVYVTRQRAGAELFDAAVEHHKAKRLTADITKGTTSNRDGQQSRFVAYDWGKQYEEAPHFVWFDFFRPAVMNSVSRMKRGLKP